MKGEQSPLNQSFHLITIDASMGENHPAFMAISGTNL